MDTGYIFLIIFGIIFLMVSMSAMGGSSNQGLGGGGKGFVGGAKKNLGIIGLLVILLGSLAFTNCLALQGA